MDFVSLWDSKKQFPDNVYIYDGDSTSAPLIVTIASPDVASSYMSSQSKVLISFVSDGNRVYNGFSITYTSISEGMFSHLRFIDYFMFTCTCPHVGLQWKADHMWGWGNFLQKTVRW